MAEYIAKYVGNKVFKETAKNKFGAEDPYFEKVPATRLGVIKTTRKKRKALPPGLTDEEAKILTKVKRRAYRLDLCLFNFCGTRLVGELLSASYLESETSSISYLLTWLSRRANKSNHHYPPA